MPVFPWRAGYLSDVGIKGVPVCRRTGTPCELGPVAPPESWIRARGNRIEPLTGSAEQWAAECGIVLAAPPTVELATIDAQTIEDDT